MSPADVPLHPPRGCAPGRGGRCCPPSRAPGSQHPRHTPLWGGIPRPPSLGRHLHRSPLTNVWVSVCLRPPGGGRSWHLPLPSAVPGPEHGARRVLSDAALSASWGPAPRGPHASAFPSAVAPWASGRRFHLLPLSPLGGSSSGSRSEELPASAPSESTRCRRRRRSGLPPPPRLPTRGPRRRLCLRGFCPSGPCRSLSGRHVSPWPCFLHPGKRLLHYPESPTLPCPHVGGGWSLRIPWG